MWVIGALVLVVALVAWLLLRNSTAQQHDTTAECPRGDLTIPYALIDASAPQQLFDDYLATHPKTQDYCVTGFQKVELADAAFALTAHTDADTQQRLEKAKRTAATQNWPTAQLIDVGVAAGPQATDLKDAALVSTQSDAAAVAAVLRGSNQWPPLESLDQVAAQNKPFAALSNASMPPGYSFHAATPREAWPERVVALQTAQKVTEEQARGAAEFAKFVDSKGLRATPGVVSALKFPTSDQAGAGQAATEAPAPQPAQTSAALPANTDTLIVLDTSNSMAAHLPAVKTALADTARDLGAAGARIGLWNYSSPLSLGVTKSWRNNVSIIDDSQGINAANAVSALGSGGVPNTVEALTAADQVAADYQRETGREVRILLVTSGTADAPGFSGTLASRVAVVHVGAEGVDAELAKRAQPALKAPNDADITNAVRKAVGLVN
ncbi:vWA domain-containing protein [Corynebacterium epidermidicanis]|nr:vWA domain-containing protein [Corynebacterium epidermidicanis]